MNKLYRYRIILVKIVENYWDTRKHLYKHQEARIWRMIHKKYPNVVILDGHYGDRSV